jgi:hypothetical protein
MKHGDSLSNRAAGPTGSGPQERPSDLLPPDLPPGAVYYEASDVKALDVGKALGGLVVVTVLVVALLYPGFLWMRSHLQGSDPPPPPMGRHEPGRLPAEPRLQTTPAQDLAAGRVDDQRLLTTYGWVDEQRRVVHIPIDEAMRRIAERGLPSAAATPASPSAPPPSAVAPEAHR